MALFTEVEAKHFFSIPPQSVAPDTSFRDWVNARPVGPIIEGTLAFEELRAQAHREVERLLLLGANHYRRAHDLLNAISSPWAFVTLYYGSFFVASALLGSLGAWKLRDNRVLEVSHAAPTSQRFQVSNAASSYRGSHQKFWEFYFRNVVSLVAGASAQERFALAPVSADVTWLISRRNDFNYDTYAAIDLAELHQSSFTSTNFPSSLPGALTTQFRFLESLLILTNRVVRSVGINSDALLSISAGGTRSQRVRDLVVRDSLPALGRKVRLKVVCG